MKRKALLLLLPAVLAAYAGARYWRPAAPVPQAVASVVPPSASTIRTAHYTIASTATAAETTRVAGAVERLYTAYATVFPLPAPTRASLQLVLYRDRAQFKAYNRSRPWAEAYYRAPRCHAYYAAGEPNPYHWMVHEATHQLDHEVAHFHAAPWIEEGLASYFGASRIEGGVLHPGSIDAHAYPIWWLPRLGLSGDAAADIRAGRIIPLRDLVAGTGPDIDRYFNLYYIEYWSLSHFLFHYQDGRYAQRYKALIAAGGSLRDFERVLGPVERLQAEWYEYLRERIGDVAGPEIVPL